MADKQTNSPKAKGVSYLSALLVLVGVLLGVALIGLWLLSPGEDVVQGQVEVSEYRVSSKVPGRLKEIRVKEGQRVVAGDTLAILEAPEVMAKMDQARAAQAAALAQDAKARKGARSEQIQTALQMWHKAQVGVEIASKSLERLTNLHNEGIVPLQRLDEVRAQRDAAVATERAAYAQYTMALNGAEQEDRAAAQAMTQRAQGAVSEVEAYIAETYLIASETGEVVDVFPMVGELVGTGAPVMNIAVLGDMWLSFHLREDRLVGLAMGQEVKAIVPALGDREITCRVSYMRDLGNYAAWRATKTRGQYDLRTFEVRALLATPVEGLRPGMTVVLKP